MAAKKTSERLAVAKTYKIYIDGKFPRTESGRYFALEDRKGDVIANVCRGSRKDFRNSVVAARKAQPGWAKASAYLRGQILYRIAEMLEGRREQFIAELRLQGVASRAAQKEVDASIDGKFPRTESGRYFALEDRKGGVIANVCRGSRKDFRNSVVAARKAQPGWAKASAYLRGQVLYRIAEMLEGRREQFIAELRLQGVASRAAQKEVDAAIDRLIYFAGWADKYQQVFSAVNPVSSSHFNFSVLEPTGVVSVIAPDDSGLLGLISNIAPTIVGGNTCVALASEKLPLCAVSFAEVLHASDVPAGVVNILTGFRSELTGQFASHMDVNAVVFCDGGKAVAKDMQEAAADNIKHVISRRRIDWSAASSQHPYLIRDTQEVKTTWHPIGV